MISIVLRGGIAVLLTKHLRIVPCLRHRAPHHCGDPDPSRTTGQTSADFSNHRVLTAFGKCISMVHFPFDGKRLVYVPPIKVAITKHGFIWTSWIGTTGGPSTTPYEQHSSLKERPADYSHGSKKTYQRSHERPLALVADV